MGTNYHLEMERCPHCGKPREELHIGKSSAGWVFALHIYPDRGVHDFPDWIDLFANPNNVIMDEYGKALKPEEFLPVVLLRFGKRDGDHLTREWLQVNQAVLGPHNLARCREDEHTKHGRGTYDLHTREYS